MCGFKLILAESKPIMLILVVVLLTSVVVFISWRKYRTYRQIWHTKHEEFNRNKESIERAATLSASFKHDFSPGSRRTSKDLSNSSLSANSIGDKERAEETIVSNGKTILCRNFDAFPVQSLKTPDVSIQVSDRYQFNLWSTGTKTTQYC